MKIYIVYNDDMDYGSNMDNTIESIWSTEEKAKIRIKYLNSNMETGFTPFGDKYTITKFWDIYEEEVN